MLHNSVNIQLVFCRLVALLPHMVENSSNTNENDIFLLSLLDRKLTAITITITWSSSPTLDLSFSQSAILFLYHYKLCFVEKYQSFGSSFYQSTHLQPVPSVLNMCSLCHSQPPTSGPFLEVIWGDSHWAIHLSLPVRWTHLFRACVNNLSWVWAKERLRFLFVGLVFSLLL